MRPKTIASVTAAAVATTFDRTQNSPVGFTWNSVLEEFDKTARNFVHVTNAIAAPQDRDVRHRPT
jgi:hypothetical protein